LSLAAAAGLAGAAGGFCANLVPAEAQSAAKAIPVANPVTILRFMSFQPFFIS
jgi:hypothetical protein